MRDYENELNKEQLEAVMSPYQYTRVVAGAGSGKTRVLTYRIAYLIEEMHVFPSRILAITFTNKVAREMKERAIKLVEQDNCGGLDIMTYHKFGAMFLRREINNLNYPGNFLIIDEEDQSKIMKDISEAHGSTRTDEFVKETLRFISYYKGQGKYPSDVNVKISEIRWSNAEKLLAYYEDYEDYKGKNFALDFDDLILRTIQILEDFPEVRERWQKKYKHILIDEFQDTNNLEYKLINLLIKEDTSLYVVGDPDQTIYTWRGANQNIIMDFSKDFPDVEDIVLNKNYRSTKLILDPANKLISYNKNRLKKDLVSINGDGTNVVVCGLNNSKEEARWVVRQIHSLERKHYDFKMSDVVILYRSNYLSSRLEPELTRESIPYVIYGGLRFYERKEIKDCLAYFRLLCNPDDNISFERIINSPRRNIGSKTLGVLKAEAELNNVSLFNYLLNIKDYESELKSSARVTLGVLVEQIIAARTQYLEHKNEKLSPYLDNYLDNVGYTNYVLALEDGEERFQNVKALLEQIDEFYVRDGVADLETFLQEATLQSSQDDIEEKDVLKLMTVHTAKGLEFKYVFIFGFNELVFPNNRAVTDSPVIGMEEERRLAYVAFTRAKEQLFISYTSGDYNYVTGRKDAPSRFLKEAGLIKNTEKIEQKSNNFYNSNYDYRSKNTETIYTAPTPKKNNNHYEIGDLVKSTSFGTGVVKEISGGTITVEFEDGKTRKLLGSHPSISKLNNSGGKA